MKLINWSKMPRGTMTNYGEFLNVMGDQANVLTTIVSNTRPHVWTFEQSKLRIAPQTRWTHHDDRRCPVPCGLDFYVLRRDGRMLSARELNASNHSWTHSLHMDSKMFEITAYKITHVNRESGWTDDPMETNQHEKGETR